ncbi:hypothetical protein AG1IA_00574 [Rhizoctonia solani AG-1 IA]|uniref:Uncharacterized protein n=1 Tax=Thanatephorus cucumeris (strain AG1-IA) TaxID=983506 RepID=L8X8K4_THACA|nr:hypothetical protein AG1IA_00574 [Rhizoctonia solani AG-1 IA]
MMRSPREIRPWPNVPDAGLPHLVIADNVAGWGRHRCRGYLSLSMMPPRMILNSAPGVGGVFAMAIGGRSSNSRTCERARIPSICIDGVNTPECVGAMIRMNGAAAAAHRTHTDVSNGALGRGLERPRDCWQGFPSRGVLLWATSYVSSLGRGWIRNYTSTRGCVYVEPACLIASEVAAQQRARLPTTSMILRYQQRSGITPVYIQGHMKYIKNSKPGPQRSAGGSVAHHTLNDCRVQHMQHPGYPGVFLEITADGSTSITKIIRTVGISRHSQGRWVPQRSSWRYQSCSQNGSAGQCGHQGARVGIGIEGGSPWQNRGGEDEWIGDPVVVSRQSAPVADLKRAISKESMLESREEQRKTPKADESE